MDVRLTEWARWIVRQGRNPEHACPECAPLGVGVEPMRCVPHEALAFLGDGVLPEPAPLDVDALARVLCHRGHITGYRWCRRHKDEADAIAADYTRAVTG